MTGKRIMMLAGLVLAGCAAEVPDSGRGVGFGDYDAYLAQQAARREAAMRAAEAPPAITAEDLATIGIGSSPAPAPQPAPAPAPAPQAVAVAPAPAPVPAPAPAQVQPAPVQAAPSNPAPVLAGSPSISDEQDFGAVSARETIQSDAERRAEQAAAYQLVTPTALPERSGDSGPNIVAFALQTTNAKGQPVYSRFLLSGQNRFLRNCAKYRSPDEAQRDFLARGGPERDRLGIDPDGDGFACGWDPAPFRLAAAGAGN